VAGLGVQDAQNLLGVHFDGDRLKTRAVDHGGNLAGDANAAGGILVELAIAGTWRGLAITTSGIALSFLSRARRLQDTAPFVEGQ
jgi:hypothetical protein